MADLGKGVPLHSVPVNSSLFIVEFKAGRTDLFYSSDPHIQVKNGDLVIVEADRGKDLGKVRHDSVTLDEVQAFQQSQVEMALGQLAAAPQTGSHVPNPSQIARMTKEIHPKKLYGKAKAEDMTLLISKAQDEAKALAVCRQKVAQKNLPMEVTDAEWQFDRRKLTFFFVADRRIDFRELVRELFRTFKTRIWMVTDSRLITFDLELMW
ncbi:PSP1-domain-containing protein [Atractiella rhizophila]|nr:PSP1-domain-containing protein [Atractiella rhizophila]